MKKYKDNNKGFTLVEILAVVVLIAIALTFAFRAYTYIINKSKEKTTIISMDNIMNAAELYSKENKDVSSWWGIQTGQVNQKFYCVPIQELINEGYFGNNKNIASDNGINNNSLIKVVKDMNNMTIIKTEITNEENLDECTNSLQAELSNNNGLNNNNSYIITYYYNDGTDRIINDTYSSNANYSLRTPENSDFAFDGWYSNRYGGTKVGDAGEEITLQYNLKLFGHWNAKPNIKYVKIQYNVNGGSLIEPHGDVLIDTSTSLVKIDETPIIHILAANENLSVDGLLSPTNDKLLNLKKTGHVIVPKKEWCTMPDGTGTCYNQKTQYNASDFCNKNDCTITLYANWKTNKVNIRINANGGKLASTHGDSYGISDSLITHNNSTTIHSINYGSTLSDSGLVNWNSSSNLNLERTGYHVDSNSVYCTKADGTGKCFNQTTAYPASDFCDASNGDCTITLYTNWKINSYTITYNGNGNTEGSTATTTCNHNADCTLRSNGFTKTGNTFAGWYTAASGGTKYGASTKLTGNITVYAHWNLNKIKIQYNMNGGSLASAHGSTIGTSGSWITVNGSTTALSLNYGTSLGTDGLANWNNSTYINITRTGYTAKSGVEWCLTGMTTCFNQAGSIAASSFCDAKDGDCTANLYVNWQINSYTITYDGNGNTGGSTSSTTCDYNTTCNLRSNGFTKTGYTFEGWYTAASGGTKYGASTKLTGNITVYAHWRINKVIVKFNANSGSVSSESGQANNDKYEISSGRIYRNGTELTYTMDYGTKHDLPNVNSKNYLNLIRKGYHYPDGTEWCKKADGTGGCFDHDVEYPVSDYCNAASSDCTITLYTHWVGNKINIKYNMNGGSLASSHGSTIGTSGSWITVNGSTIAQTLNYGASLGTDGLANWNNSSYINITKTGYRAKSGSEWCLSGMKTCFSHAGSIAGSKFCDASYSDCTASLYVNWEINKVNIKYNMNGGSLASSHGSTIGTSGNWITVNGSTIAHSVNYGASLGTDGLANWNNSSYINITRAGYNVKSGSEWCLSGMKTCFSHSGSIAASSLCNASSNSCNAELYVNWQGIAPSVAFSPDGGTHYSPKDVGITCTSEAGISSFTTVDNLDDHGRASSDSANNTSTKKVRYITLSTTGSRSITATCVSTNGKKTEITKSFTIKSSSSSSGGGGGGGGGNTGSGSSSSSDCPCTGTAGKKCGSGRYNSQGCWCVGSDCCC